MQLIVTGSLAYDRIMDFPDRFKNHILPDKIHVLNVSFVLQKLEERFGGTSGNIAYNLSLLGLDPLLVGVLGGVDSERYLKHFEACNIDTQHIRVFEHEHCAHAHIISDMDGNQITAFYPGALIHGHEHPLPHIKGDALLVIAPSSKEEMCKRRLEAKQQDIPYVFDPGQQITALSPEESIDCARDARVAIFNDYEWELFQKKTGLSKKDVLDYDTVLIVTGGRAGSMIYEKEKEYRIGVAQAHNVIDPTGAGDAYRAGLLAGMAYGWDWQTTGQVAATISSFVVENYGTQEHAPTMQDLQERYEKHFAHPWPLKRTQQKQTPLKNDINF